jgi:CHAT domain-containing protein
MHADADTRHALLMNNAPLRTRRLVSALSRRVESLANEQKPAEAAALLDLARAVANELDDPAALADVLAAESIVRRRPPHHDLNGSIRTARMAVALAEKSGDPDALVLTLCRLAYAAERTDHEEADSAGERALALAELTDDASILSEAASVLTRTHAALPREGLRYANLASAFAGESGNPWARLWSEVSQATFYFNRDDYELAAEHLRKLLDLAREVRFVAMQAAALKNLTVCRRRDSAEVYDLTRQALEILGPDGDLRERISILVTRGSQFIRDGRYAEAEAELRKAEELFPCLRNSPDVTQFYDGTMGMLRLRQHRYDEAAQYLDNDGGWNISVLLAQTRAKQQRHTEARALFEMAIETVENYRSAIDDERQRGLYLDESSWAYLSYIEYLTEIGEARAALAVAERMKARMLKDRLHSKDETGIAGKQEAERWNARITALNRRLIAIQADGGNPEIVRGELKRAHAALYEAEARATSARTAAAPEPANRSLDVPPGTIVIDYAVGDERTFAFVARRSGTATSIETHVIEISAAALRKRAENFLQRMESRDGKYRAEARRLYDLLLKPLIGTRPSGTLCIVPDRTLWTLPFQALITPEDQHLIERVALFYVPSLTFAPAGRSRHSEGAPTVLALGDPQLGAGTVSDVRATFRDARLGRLPDARREVHALRDLYGPRATIHIGAAATEATLKREAGRFDILHLATHGLVDDDWPMYSALLLNGSPEEDGLLEAREIAALPLHGDLVVLSACDTARGRVLRGEGTIGLSWAVLAAGCPRTIAAQWRVGSAAAARMMVAFHRRMARRHSVRDVAATLRQAQIEMLGNPRYAHPYYWAAFIMVGRDD